MIIKRETHSGISWGYRFERGTRSSRQTYSEFGFETKNEAKTAEAVKLLELSAQPKVTAKPKLLSELIGSFLDDKKPGIAPLTYEDWDCCLKWISKELMARKANTITPLEWHNEWKRILTSGSRQKAGKPVAATSVRKLSHIVSLAYRWARLFGLVAVNPVADSQPPKGGAVNKAIALTVEQMELMLGAAPEPLATFLTVCADLGARRGEVLALRWSDLQGGFATIGRSLMHVGGERLFKGTKKDRVRIVEVPSRMTEALKAHRKAQAVHKAHFGKDYRTDLDLIFCEADGSPLQPDQISLDVSKLCARLKLPKGARLHALRHTHGSQLIRSGVPVTEVSARLGHANPAVTMGIYAHEIPGRSEAARVWDQITERKGEKRQ